jgi:hypothetical protein
LVGRVVCERWQEVWVRTGWLSSRRPRQLKFSRPGRPKIKRAYKIRTFKPYRMHLLFKIHVFDKEKWDKELSFDHKFA